MKIKVLSGYFLIIIISFMLHYIKPGRMYYGILPVLMIAYPVFSGNKIRLNFSIRDILIGFSISFIILLPYHLVFGGDIERITFAEVLFQFIGVAFPEEVFFRGYIQESFKRNFKAVLITSLLFSLSHLPEAMFSNDWISLLSFFPSLIMGWLYLKTGNILPGVIFHFFANVIY
ncbi:MAG: CPBP family intramembrane metalloprotease [Nitrospirae bacterium]|jgi:membrane protease YdiL (CAAX protease family)|nr:CPBP family intramembrane metalloprotease [Nitrospirota bacterium]